MARGKHAARRGIGSVVLLVALSVLLLSVAGSAVAAYRYDRSTVSRIMPGVHIAGIDVGDMTRAEAAERVRTDVERRLSRHLVIEAGGRVWDRTLGDLGMSADVDAAVDRAMEVGRGFSWLTRVFHRVANKPVERSIDVELAFDDTPIKDFVRTAFHALKVEPTSASLALVDGEPQMLEGTPGRELKTWVSRRMLADAVQGGVSRVELPMVAVRPEVTEENLGRTITVDLSTNTLRLYDGFDVIRTYSVATAMQGYETPPGTWTIYNKVENPTWVNGAKDTWGADLPDEIPPGPGNPLGTRALYLDAPGIRIHGTYSDSSIGTYASHGCIRMHIPESEELYPLVPIGTKVLVYGAPPWGNVSDPGTAGV